MSFLRLISFPEFFPNEEKSITHILNESNVLLHLRKPKVSEEDYMAFVKRLPKVFYPRLVLHSCYHLAKDFEFAGVHFSTRDRNFANKIDLDCAYSTSIHSLGELNSLDPLFDEVFLSPVFPSISKEGYEGILDLKKVALYLKSDRRIKIIALGGITKNNISRVLEMGFDGAAVLGSVWGKEPIAGHDFITRIKDFTEKL